MVEVEIDIEKLTVQELLATTAGVASALENNPNFPSPTPTPAQLDQLANDLSQAEERYREERATAAAARSARDDIAVELRAALAKEVEYVQKASGGSIAKILSANLHVDEGSSIWPFNRLGQVEEVSISAGDQPGEIDLAWDPVAGASGYEVQIAYDLLGEGPWEQSGATTGSKITIEKLNNRTRYWFRVHAVREGATGEWSEPVTRFAR